MTQLHHEDSSRNSPRRLSARSTPIRRPLIGVTFALSCGILVDQNIDISSSFWLLLAAFSTLISFATYRRNRYPMICSATVLLVVFALGGLRHHQYVHHRFEDNILRITSEDQQTARIVGVVVSSIDLIEAERGPRISPWLEIDSSRFVLAVEQYQDGGVWKGTSGRLSVSVTGHLVHVQVGDRISILGKLSRPSPVSNPGGFDFRESLQRQGIDALFRVNHPAAVTSLGRAHPWWWSVARLREAIRQEARELFVQHLSQPAYQLSLSILLGDRTQLKEETKDQFINSGTMHLLAISGLHVGILAGLLSLVCRLLNCTPQRTLKFVILGVILYAMLTNHRPPVLRATMLITMLCIGMAGSRFVDGFNTLALCASLLLIWNPAHLFEIGAQLSFLAVGAILWSRPATMRNMFKSESVGLPDVHRWDWVNWFKPLRTFLYQGYLITAAVWLATLPLTISTFHLVAPVGFLLNIFLIPYVAVSLSFGYLFLLIGLLVPAVAKFAALPFEWSLQGLLWIVQWGEAVPYGHFYCSGIANWWLIGFYFLLAFCWQLLGSFPMSQWSWKAIILWIVLGFSLGLVPQQQTGLRYTVLAVGHGMATVIELPTGETVLYDGGTLGDGRRAEQAIEQYLQFRQKTHIDAIIISHADHDHFGGLFGLFEKFTVGTVLFHRSFLDFDQIRVQELCEVISARKCSIRLVRAGDRIFVGKSPLENSPTLQVLHPRETFRSPKDNVNSIVLSIEYAGRTILLTGDLEQNGITEVMSGDRQQYDIVMAPHHGSKHSSPQNFFDWTSPTIVIVSSGDRSAMSRLQAQLGSSMQVIATQTSGAITVKIDPEGNLQVQPFRRTE